MFLLAGFAGTCFSAEKKRRLLVVSSYHRAYAWFQETNKGFCKAMYKYGYFDSEKQGEEFSKNDSIETSTTIVKKIWMDTKRKKSKKDIANTVALVKTEVDAFQPDLLFLGDDNAAKYIGRAYLDKTVPIVLWGVNITPVKYGLVKSIEKPGHNVTGVYQVGYYQESIDFFKKIVPSAKTFAILGDNSISSKAHTMAVKLLARQKKLPLKLTEIVNTDNFEIFKKKALDLQTKVDVFYISQYSTLKDKTGHHIPKSDVAKWYLQNIKIPEVANQDHFVEEGLLCAANDSGVNQGFEAVTVANELLTKQLSPANFPFRTPPRGKLMVNRERASMLDIKLEEGMGIEQYLEKAKALH